MAMDPQMKNVIAKPEIDKVEKKTSKSATQPKALVERTVTKSIKNDETLSVIDNQKNDKNGVLKEKEPTQSSLESAVSSMNSRMKRTRCEYDFDDPTNTITVKIYDKKTDELIREVPPEKSLEAIKKIWEIAGLIVDEKR